MPRTAYTYTKARYNVSLLSEITTAGLPAAVLSGRGDELQLSFAAALRVAEVATLDALVAAYNPARTIFEQAKLDWENTWGSA